MNTAKRIELFRRLSEANPSPETELEYDSPYQLLAAVLMSAQATDKSVNLVTRRLFPLAPTPQAMVALGLEAITENIRTIGLFRNKAKNLLAMSQILLDQHDGEVPDDREALEALPGVGRKTANVVLNVAFGHPTIAVDTHIFRVSNRTGLAPGKDVDAVEQKLLKVVPDEYRLHAHHWLILHGRYICKARTPECWRCPIHDLCDYKPKTLPPPHRSALDGPEVKARPAGKKDTGETRAAPQARTGPRSPQGARTQAKSGVSRALRTPAKPAGPTSP